MSGFTRCPIATQPGPARHYLHAGHSAAGYRRRCSEDARHGSQRVVDPFSDSQSDFLSFGRSAGRQSLRTRSEGVIQTVPLPGVCVHAFKCALRLYILRMSDLEKPDPEEALLELEARVAYRKLSELAPNDPRRHNCWNHYMKSVFGPPIGTP